MRISKNLLGPRSSRDGRENGGALANPRRDESASRDNRLTPGESYLAGPCHVTLGRLGEW